MKRYGITAYFGAIGTLAGAVIGEFFPKLFNDSLMGAIGHAFSEPFSGYRNDLAVKYGLSGLVIGLVIGLISAFLIKKK
jgi:uncharacterized protein YqgC (DUF456 family)